MVAPLEDRFTLTPKQMRAVTRAIRVPTRAGYVSAYDLLGALGQCQLAGRHFALTPRGYRVLAPLLDALVEIGALHRGDE